MPITTLTERCWRAAPKGGAPNRRLNFDSPHCGRSCARPRGDPRGMHQRSHRAFGSGVIDANTVRKRDANAERDARLHANAEPIAVGVRRPLRAGLDGRWIGLRNRARLVDAR